MDEHRRKLLKVTSIAHLPTVAGCAEQSSGSEDEPTPEQTSSTSAGTTTTAPSKTETPTDTQSDATTTTSTDSGTSGVETDTPTDTETATPTETTPSADSVAVVINNVGFQAWEVIEDESGSVASTNENNPTLSLEVGQRYAVENRGWSAHPFAIRAADDTPLLSQSVDGRLEADDAVNWTDDGETFALTYTEDVAAAADYYICTVYSGMRGSIETV